MPLLLPKLTEHEGVLVVRDDLFPGGTKARVLPALLKNCAEEIVYTSPAYGYAQVALAYACKQTGQQATIFIPARKEKLAPLTLEAANAGAKIIQIPMGFMSVLKARARLYCEERGATLLPMGLDTPTFIAALAAVAKRLPVDPKEVWCVVGSGTLARALALAWPRAKLNCVRVGMEPHLPPGATLYLAPEKYERPAKLPPPFASCANYDAKAWRFISEHASPGALFWNVAG